LGGSTEVLDTVDSTGLSLIALPCTEPSAQQVLFGSVRASSKNINYPLIRNANANFSGRRFCGADSNRFSYQSGFWTWFALSENYKVPFP
jgi:hypothetical protein